MKTLTLTPKKSLSLNELLRAELPRLFSAEVSHSKIRRLIVAGGVSVGGKPVRVPSFLVHPKSRVTVQIDEEKFFFEKKPCDIDFELSEKDILFEDDCIIVVNKPTHFPTEAGMVDSRDNLHAAVVRFLFARQKIERPNAKNPPYVGIMHRLDRDTSGVILFTKTRAVNSFCHALFENHTAQKLYEAVICVKNADAEKFPIGTKFSVEFPIGRISPKGQAAKWGSVSEKNGGLHSKTEFTVLKEMPPTDFKGMNLTGNGDSKNHFFLVECRPLTGRTHQIRVHLASRGTPILGDTLYGGEPCERILLHAKSLTFPHPVTGDILKIEAQTPFAQSRI